MDGRGSEVAHSSAAIHAASWARCYSGLCVGISAINTVMHRLNTQAQEELTWRAIMIGSYGSRLEGSRSSSLCSGSVSLNSIVTRRLKQLAVRYTRIFQAKTLSKNTAIFAPYVHSTTPDSGIKPWTPACSETKIFSRMRVNASTILFTSLVSV